QGRAAKKCLEHGSTTGETDIDLRHAHRCFFRGIENVASGSETETGPKRHAVDGCDHRLRTFADRIGGFACHAVVVQKITGDIGGRTILEIGARAENLVYAGQYGTTDVLTLRNGIESRYDLATHLAIQRIDRSTVHRDQRDVVGYFKANKLLGHHSSPSSVLTDRSVSLLPNSNQRGVTSYGNILPRKTDLQKTQELDESLGYPSDISYVLLLLKATATAPAPLLCNAQKSR